LVVSVNAQGRQVVSASTPVSLREDLSAGGPLKKARVIVLPKWLVLVSLAGVGGSVLIMVYLLMLFAPSRNKVRRRLRHIEGFTSEQGAAALAEEQRGSAVVRAALELSEKAVQSKGNQNQIETSLDRAGMNLRANEWLLIRALATGGGAIGLSIIMPWYFGMIFGGFLGFAVPGLYRKLRAARRAKKFADLLPDSLQLMVSALRSGFSLPQAIDALVREGTEPVSSEFGRALSEIRIGAELEEALERCASRNGSRDLAWLVMAIRIQHEVGGSLSEVLETAVETMRERARLARHVRGLSAEGRLSAYVLIGLPVVLAAYMFAVRREYLEPLYTQPLGILMLIGAVIMLGVGSFWMIRVVKVEV
jgi:tight adherence protein B